MAKSRTTKLPKRIAGVRLSKPFRKRGGKLLDLLRHPLAADIAAAALIAAAATLRNNPRVRTAAARTRDKASDAASSVGQGAASLGSSMAARASRAYHGLTDSETGDGGKSKKAH